MPETVIKLENISKQYRLGTVGSQTLRGDLQRWWHNIRGKEDPALKIGQSNKLDTVEGEYVWALKDINLEVKQGEILGIIGKNGAGKSTLLKLLSRVTGPTTGQIKIKGRIASLLEVGTGFHPELTGRENVFLNGAILGMTKNDIHLKFDEIVEFAGVVKYIDTPVKRYSSGMYVRLAFAVAAHLEPDILVVDEVLAVGDAEFQKKAIGKMQDVSRGGGRTVLFVSHNMASVKQLCNSCVLLKNGSVFTEGKTTEVVDFYLSDGIASSNFGLIPENYPRNNWIKNEAYFREINLLNSKKEEASTIKLFEEIEFEIKLEVIEKIEKASIVIWIGNEENDSISYSASNQYESDNFLLLEKGISAFRMRIKQKLLPGSYFINASIFRPDGYPFDGIRKFGEFTITNFSENNIKYPWSKSFGFVFQDNEFI